jgi:heme-degrading monooxygenase HmoA
VIIGVMSSVDDVSALMVKVHDGLERFKRGGIRKIWVYRALDDGREVMILQEIEDEAAARQWIEHPDAAAEWMSKAGLGAYPTQFVGTFAHLMTVDEPS